MDYKTIPELELTTIAKLGETPLSGAVTLSAGANVTLEQVGQDIKIGSTGGGSGVTLFAFAGRHVAAGTGLTTAYHANVSPGPGASSETQNRYEVAQAARTVRNLRVRVKANGHTTATTITVMQNLSATTATVSIPAGATGAFTSVVSVAFLAGDTLDLRSENTSGGVSTALDFSAVVEVV